MEFKLHGVRGSIPVPSKEALKYGGNTTCIEISNASFQLIIDLGSGFQNVKIRKNIPKFIVLLMNDKCTLASKKFLSSSVKKI